MPGISQQLDDALSEIIVLRDLLAQQSAILKQIQKVLDDAQVKPVFKNAVQDE